MNQANGYRDDFATGEHECFCDMQYPAADKRQTCGDCPRDYIAGAWPARLKYLDALEQSNTASMPSATAGAAMPNSCAAPVREVATGNRYQRRSRPCVSDCPQPPASQFKQIEYIKRGNT